MPASPTFYEMREAGLSTEVGYFDSLTEIDFEALLSASEEDRRNKESVIRDVVADRDAWVGHFRLLEADRDAWRVRYETIRNEMIASEHDLGLRQGLVRALTTERDAAVPRS